ncbi:FHA domain-containing protein [Synechococcus lacustris]|uniref:FHA domain-containing protein n=1 Tax=Synechococcus lacustris TaxID=2116544 RepID=UPI0028F450BD|nr:FHA domain-containing protein [Synechococcus lacustris]
MVAAQEPAMKHINGAQLMLRNDPTKTAALSTKKPLTIGKASTNLLCMPKTDGVAEHHAVVRWSLSHGWLICDWGSQEGTFLEGQRIRNCRPINDGDEIQLGKVGPVLVFRLAPVSSQPTPEPAVKGSAGGNLEFAGQFIPMNQIKFVQLLIRPRYPASFSWWALLSLSALIFLPWPGVFWTLELVAFAGWIVLGSRKEHVLLVTLVDGMAYRHNFANKITALAHRNGIRKAIGQPSSI